MQWCLSYVLYVKARIERIIWVQILNVRLSSHGVM